MRSTQSFFDSLGEPIEPNDRRSLPTFTTPKLDRTNDSVTDRRHLLLLLPTGDALRRAQIVAQPVLAIQEPRPHYWIVARRLWDGSQKCCYELGFGVFLLTNEDSLPLSTLPFPQRAPS